MAFRIRRVGHLVLRVKDIERSKCFFQEILGFPVVAENERGMFFFSTDVKDNHHMLAIVQAKEGAAMPTSDHVGMQHVSFELGNFAELQEAYRLFKEKGVNIHYTTFHGVAKSVYFFLILTETCLRSIATSPRRNIESQCRMPILDMALSRMNWRGRFLRNRGRWPLEEFLNGFSRCPGQSPIDFLVGSYIRGSSDQQVFGT